MNNYMKTIVSGLKQWISSQKSDWNQNDSSAANFIKNRPFYSEEKEKKILNETIEIYGNEGELNYTGFYSRLFPIVGKEYKVVVNGEEHTCVAEVYQSQDAICLGNVNLLEDVSAAGENFVIDTYSNGDAYLNIVGSGTYNVEIYGTVEEVHKIDKKYVPIPDLSDVAFSGDYWDLENTPYIPQEVVQYNETQYLNDNQKLIARNNIGASGATNLLNGSFTGSLRSYNSAEESSDYSMGYYSVALGRGTKASGHASHAEGVYTVASGECSHAEGSSTTASGECSHAEGSSTTASERYSHAEGHQTIASGEHSHAEGYHSIATAQSSHAEGWSTYSASAGSHSEGFKTAAFGSSSHAEGEGIEQLGYITGEANATTYLLTSSLYNNLRIGMIISYAGGSYAEVTAINGNQVTLDKTLSSTALTNAPAYVLSGGYALGSYSHSEGYGTIAIGDASHAEGVATIAASNNQHAQGRHNIEDSANKYAHIVGNGSSAATRSNAHTLDWDGNAWFAGKIKVGGTGYDDASAVEVALKSDLANIDGAVIVDDILSSTSTNPVQNKVINTAISNLNTLVGGKAVSEQIEDAIANSSGASVPSNWNAEEGEPGHVMNRPFYSENRPVVLLETTTLTANGSFAGVDGVGFLTELLDVGGGMKYNVTYNGVDYTCTARFTIFNDIPCFILGNSYAFGDENTGEPFLVCAFPEAIAAEVGVYGGVIPLDGSGTFSISISKITEVVHKLPSKFMPDGVAFVGDGQTEIFPPTTLVFDNGTCDILLSDFNHDFIVGETYTVTIDGISFNSVVQALEGEDMLWNKVLGNFTGETGEPFVIVQYTDEIAEITGSKIRIAFPGFADLGESASATLSIIRNKAVHKLADECLPDDALTTKNLAKKVQALSDDEKANIRGAMGPLMTDVTDTYTLDVDGWEEYKSMGYLYKIPTSGIISESDLVIAFPANVDSRYEFYTRNCRYYWGNALAYGVMCDTKPTKAINVRFVLGSPYEEIVV